MIIADSSYDSSIKTEERDMDFRIEEELRFKQLYNALSLKERQVAYVMCNDCTQNKLRVKMHIQAEEVERIIKTLHQKLGTENITDLKSFKAWLCKYLT